MDEQGNDKSRLTIARRFNGPPDSGNGGYVCGAFAVASGEDVRVRLLSPPPLERELTLQPGDTPGSFVLQDGELRIASATAAHLDLDVPPPPPYVQAVWASQHYVGFKQHSFPDCFVCGPHLARCERFAGRVEEFAHAGPRRNSGRGHHRMPVNCPSQRLGLRRR